MTTWEIIALRYATHGERLASTNLLYAPGPGEDPHDAPMPIDYFVWLLRSGDRTIVVDTGFDHPTATKHNRALLQHPVEGLRALGVDPATVADVIITHLHYDHAGNLPAFPAATFHLQDGEMAYATGRCMCHARLRNAFEVEDVCTMVRRVYEGRVNFIDGSGEIAPGVTVHPVPGHTRGLQCVRVETALGPVVLASDAAHTYANIRQQNPFPIVVDVAAMMDSWRQLETLAGTLHRVVPGHDPLVFKRYPRHPSAAVEAVLLHEPPLPGPDPFREPPQSR